jgi:DNA invertase Pin-like site-specific DNA recombinase
MRKTDTPTAAIYCRISRDREGAGLGVQRQEEDCRQLAASLGWTVVRASSLTTTSRPTQESGGRSTKASSSRCARAAYKAS